MLPVLHLNGYKIANPTVLARIERDELRGLLEGYGYAPRFVEGSDPPAMHQPMAAALDGVLDEIAEIQSHARGGEEGRPAAVADDRAEHAKGWTGPKEVDGLPAEGSFRSHQVPLGEVRTNPEHLAQLESWMRSYRPEELFDEDGAVLEQVTALAPEGELRMSANPHANGGLLTRELELPDFRDYAVEVKALRRRPARRPACSAAGCATSSRPTRTASASWAPMRPSQTGSGRCSRPRTECGRRDGLTPTITWRQRAR